MKDISRRTALKLLGAGVATAFSGVSSATTDDKMKVATTEALKPLVPTDNVKYSQRVFDAHAHFFNLTDVQGGGYLTRPVLNEMLDIPNSGPIRRFFDLTGVAIQRHGSKFALNAQDELRDLEEIQSNNVKKAANVAALSEKSIRQLYEPSVDDFFTTLESDDKDLLKQIDGAYQEIVEVDSNYRKMINDTESSMSSHKFDKELFLELSEEEPFVPQDLFQQKFVNESFVVSATAATKVSSIVRFLRHMFSTRETNIVAYQKLYSQGKGASVQHALDITCDFDFWLGCEETISSMQSQVLLHEALHKRFNGFNVPMLGVNPWKMAEDRNNTYFDFVKETLNNKIFKGIKVYPQIGYSITGITMDDREDVYRCRKKPHPTKKQLVKAMDNLMCIAQETNSVVMAHTTHSQGATRESRMLGKPSYWEELINNRPSLKVNLGHTGGEDDLLGWNTEFMKMLNSSSHSVYGDLGYWQKLMQPYFVKELLEKTTPQQRKRLMYGTDWFMTSKNSWSPRYLSKLHESFRYALGSDTSTLDDIFYNNAARLFEIG